MASMSPVSATMAVMDLSCSSRLAMVISYVWLAIVVENVSF
jgi:hypothetical protein